MRESTHISQCSRFHSGYLHLTCEHSFRPYSSADKKACLTIFDENCPPFFAPKERGDYEEFLDASPVGYEVCEIDGRIVAAFGLIRDDRKAARLNWIMLDPNSKGMGLGSRIMKRVISHGRASHSPLIEIAASHKSAPFFARFGATVTTHTADGWGRGMDRIDMELLL